MKDTGSQTFEIDGCLQFYKVLENIENLYHNVDDLSQGEDHGDQKGNPGKKDIVKYYHLFIVSIVSD